MDLRPGADSAPVLAGDLQGVAVDLDAHRSLRPTESGAEREHTRARTQIDDRPSRDVAVEISQVDEMGGDSRGRSVLLEGRVRFGKVGDVSESACQLSFGAHQWRPA